MAIVFFLILAGVWAVFLLPPLFEGRRSGPTGSLRSLERSVVLANIAAPGGLEALARRRTLLRRKRVLIALGLVAAGCLAAAIFFNSTWWLSLAIVVDIVLAGYVTMLLSLREQAYRSAQRVVPMPAPEPVVAQPVLTQPVAIDDQQRTVRVVAG